MISTELPPARGPNILIAAAALGGALEPRGRVFVLRPLPAPGVLLARAFSGISRATTWTWEASTLPVLAMTTSTLR
ncbi:MAG: hypothetical protein M0T79_08135 [Actinomycetota bacterium]|nr:hypothetical protein [Actinomycetota bacterium]